MIVPNDIITGDGGVPVDEDTARRIIAVARSIASRIDEIPDGTEDHKQAIAILRGVARELPAPGEARLKSMSRNGTAVQIDTVRDAFSREDRRALIALCETLGVKARGPIGSFPPAGVVSRLWPEGPYR